MDFSCVNTCIKQFENEKLKCNSFNSQYDMLVRSKHETNSNMTTVNTELNNKIFNSGQNQWEVKGQVNRGACSTVQQVQLLLSSDSRQSHSTHQLGDSKEWSSSTDPFLPTETEFVPCKTQAMKVVEADSVNDSQQNEVQNQRKVHHQVTKKRKKKSTREKNLVDFLECFDCRLEGVTQRCIVMDQQPLDLGGYISIHKRVSLRTALQLTRKLNIALNVLKECGLVHMDVKPQNVLIDAEYNPYLSDLGHSVNTADNCHKIQCGSRNQRSPELMLGLHFDGQTDVYSLGMLLLEVLLGMSVIQAENSAELFVTQDMLFSSTQGHFLLDWVERSPMKEEIFLTEEEGSERGVYLMEMQGNKRRVKRSKQVPKSKVLDVRKLQEYISYVLMKQDDICAQESLVKLEQLIKGMLHRDPKQRLRTKDVEILILEIIKLLPNQSE